MRQEEAEKVIKMMLTADGGCEYCVADLLKLFCKEFPKYVDSAKKAFKEKFGKELNYFNSIKLK
jgi:hypothetical protein